MNNLVPINNTSISNLGTSGTDFVSALLAAGPNAIASPILEYQRTKEKSKLMEIAMQIRKQERADILKTIRDLAAHGQLTPEISRLLMAEYVTPAGIF